MTNSNDRDRWKPGAHLRAEIDRLGLDQVQVAAAIGVSRQTINNIVNDRQPISRAMAAKLGRLTGRSSDYWLRAHFTEPTPAFAAISEDDGPRHEEGAPARGGAVLVNHQIVRAVRDGIIGIEPFVEANVQRAALDLTLDDFIITSEGEQVDISDGHGFLLESGRAVSVRSRELIEFPLDHVGRVGAMTRLAKLGIIMSHAFQVEPGFKGHLLFCLFNAGGAGFMLRSGAAVISLEVVALGTVPATAPHTAAQRIDDERADIATHFRGATNGNVCGRLIRDFIRGRVEIEATPGKIAARIPELDLEIVEASKEAGYAGAVSSVLDTLKLLRNNADTPTELHGKYGAFFADLGDRLCLSAEEARRAVPIVGLRFTDPDQAVVVLRNGQRTVLQLPRRSGKITLRHLARQLREEPEQLVLLLTGRESAT